MNDHHHLILAIDDDADDLSLLQEAIRTIDAQATLLTAQNGSLGLEKLRQFRGEGKQPCLIVLDINMPVMDGRRTYEVIRSDDEWKAIPLVVFSTSTSPLDITYFEHKGAQYITKPVQFSQLLEVARRFFSYCKSQ